MFGGTNFRRSQFNLATQAERQPGSSFKPIVLASAFRQGIAPATRLASKPIEIDAGDRVWKVSNYEGTYLGEVDLARAMVSSDNSVYAQLTKIVGPKAIVDTAHAARDPLGAARVLLDRPRRGRRQPARHDPRVRDDRERRPARRRLDHGRPARGSCGRVKLAPHRRGCGRTSPSREPVLSKSEAETDHLDPRAGRRAGHRRARRPRRPDRCRARPARPTTTATPGSSATRPSSPSPCGSGTRTSSGRWRRSSTASRSSGGTLPALIWKAFMTKALADEPPRSFNPAPYLPSYEPPRRLPRRQLAARQRLLPRHPRRSRTSPTRRPSTTATCYANEVSVPLLVGRSRRVRPRRARVRAARRRT